MNNIAHPEHFDAEALNKAINAEKRSNLKTRVAEITGNTVTAGHIVDGLSAEEVDACDKMNDADLERYVKTKFPHLFPKTQSNTPPKPKKNCP